MKNTACKGPSCQHIDTCVPYLVIKHKGLGFDGEPPRGCARERSEWSGGSGYLSSAEALSLDRDCSAPTEGLEQVD